MTRGFHELNEMGIKVSMEQIEEQIDSGFKVKYREGHPMKDAMFDKVAMSTIKLLFDQERLPP